MEFKTLRRCDDCPLSRHDEYQDPCALGYNRLTVFHAETKVWMEVSDNCELIHIKTKSTLIVPELVKIPRDT
jgi:hypothetical protein